MSGMSIPLGLMAQGALYRSPVPTFVGYANNNTGNPTMIAGLQSGDLVVAHAFANTSAIPDVPSNWADWAPDAGTASGVGAAGRLVTAIYEPGLTIAWTGASGSRSLYGFRNAQKGVNAFVYATSGTSSCAWPTLTLAGESFVCIAAQKAGAQTDISVVEPAVVTWRADSDRVTKNTSSAALVRVSAGVVETFAPSAGSFDGGTGAHQLIAFSVLAA